MSHKIALRINVVAKSNGKEISFQKEGVVKTPLETLSKELEEEIKTNLSQEDCDIVWIFKYNYKEAFAMLEQNLTQHHQECARLYKEGLVEESEKLWEELPEPATYKTESDRYNMNIQLLDSSEIRAKLCAVDKPDKVVEVTYTKPCSQKSINQGTAKLDSQESRNQGITKLDSEEDLDFKHERIVFAAIKLKDKYVYGIRHWDNLVRYQVDLLGLDVSKLSRNIDYEEGFITNKYHFIDRKLAYTLAKTNGQLRYNSSASPVLYSEDLW